LSRPDTAIDRLTPLVVNAGTYSGMNRGRSTSGCQTWLVDGSQQSSSARGGPQAGGQSRVQCPPRRNLWSRRIEVPSAAMNSKVTHPAESCCYREFSSLDRQCGPGVCHHSQAKTLACWILSWCSGRAARTEGSGVCLVACRHHEGGGGTGPDCFGSVRRQR